MRRCRCTVLLCPRRSLPRAGAGLASHRHRGRELQLRHRLPLQLRRRARRDEVRRQPHHLDRERPLQRRGPRRRAVAGHVPDADLVEDLHQRQGVRAADAGGRSDDAAGLRRLPEGHAVVHEGPDHHGGERHPGAFLRARIGGGHGGDEGLQWPGREGPEPAGRRVPGLHAVPFGLTHPHQRHPQLETLRHQRLHVEVGRGKPK